MTLCVSDPDDEQGSVRLFDDPASHRRLCQINEVRPDVDMFFAAIVGRGGHTVPRSLDAIRIVSTLVADPEFPLEARRRASNGYGVGV
jgi:hypothetical protein